MAFTERAFELLDDNQWDDRDDDTDTRVEEADERTRIAAVLRGLRHQPRCAVTSDLQREWQRKAQWMQTWRRAERRQQKAGL